MMKNTFTSDTIFMRYPSTWWRDLWREGLVSGNGLVGANVYGGVKDETVMLTHHCLWHHGSAKPLPDVSEAFRRQREMMDREAFREASWEVVNALREAGYEAQLESPFPAADLNVQLSPVAPFEDYLRGVHMDSGETFAAWREGDSVRESTLFVSRAHSIVVKRVKSSRPDLGVTMSLTPHRNSTPESLEKWGRHILDSFRTDAEPPFLTCVALNEDGRLFGVSAKVWSPDGRVEKNRETIQVTGATEVMALIRVFAGEENDPDAVLRQEKATLDGLPLDYNALLSAHRAIHEKWYKSAALSLGFEGEYHSNEELLLDAYRGRQPLELIEKLWRYGRYLFISGTHEAGDPFPMYGLWGGDYRLEWPHNMANENIQMIYWHTYAGNLLPFQRAMFRYYNARIPAFQENARKLFGMRGIYMTAGTTPGMAQPNQVVPVIMNWVSAAAWIAQHYCRYARYVEDKAYFDASILPFLLEVADFYEDFVEYYPDGTIHFYPSVSPENTPGNFMPPKHIQMAHPMPTTVNSTIDMAILKEFFTEMCHIAEKNPALAGRVPAWRKILDAIPEYRVNDQGAIREWQDDRFDERYDHRHLSHIYPVFPGQEVNALHHAELLPAFEKAVRLREIDAQTGWSMTHMAAIYARLGDGEAALECLDKLARSCLTNNLFTLHNDWRGMNISLNMPNAPVQLDASMGYVNAIQEMLVYSSSDLLLLLPALPEALNRGRLRDFRYENGMVDMDWDIKSCLFRAELRAIRPHKVWLTLPDYVDAPRFETHRCEVVEEDGMFKVAMDDGATLSVSLEN